MKYNTFVYLYGIIWNLCKWHSGALEMKVGEKDKLF